MVVAGEPSGDLQAGLLLEQLRLRRPSWSFFGVGGPRMATQGFEQLVGIDEMAVIGFADVLRKVPFFRRVFARLNRAIKQQRPDAVILVDYPGFNLRLASSASADGLRVIYYIAPQIWAWGEGRITKMRRCVGLLIPIFPFEQEYFQSRGINTQRVGHPLLDVVKPAMGGKVFRESVGLSGDARLITLLPGSRPAEVKRHLPVMLAAVRRLTDENQSLAPVVACAPGIDQALIFAAAGKSNCRDLSVSGDTYSAIAAAELAFVKSGTATIECAMLGVPFVAMYKTGMLNYQIARRLIKTKHIAMVNLVAGETVVPEFIQHEATPENIVHAARKLFLDDDYRRKMILDLQNVRDKLGPPGGAGQAAEIIIAWLEGTTGAAEQKQHV